MFLDVPLRYSKHFISRTESKINRCLFLSCKLVDSKGHVWGFFLGLHNGMYGSQLGEMFVLQCSRGTEYELSEADSS